ncbi:MAG: NfeD family protein [Bacteroidales bacterium]|jgi:membrane protein implicated in regulation of membrane protease activity|nr:NfeD family protein [Bacteroidales bacterium]
MNAEILTRPELIWFIIGLIFLILELMLPGFVIFFFGVGAWITSLVCLVSNPGTNLQIIIFALTSVLALVALRRLLKKKFFDSREGNTVLLDDEFTGRKAIALTSFGKGSRGKVEYKGTSWPASSEHEIAAGETVLIVSKESINLIVEPIK